MDGKLIPCRFCGKFYRVYMYLVGDQSMCPTCLRRAKAEADSHSKTECGAKEE